MFKNFLKRCKGTSRIFPAVRCVLIPAMAFLLTLSGCSENPQESEPDHLVINSIFPADEAQNIPINTKIIITFSKDIEGIDIPGNVIEFDTEIAGTISKNGNRIIFTPDGYFNFSTSYTVTLNTDIQNLEGNILDGHTWSFTTGYPWREMSSMQYPKSASAAVAYGNYIYSLGGVTFENYGASLRAVERLDPINNSWVEMEPMIKRRGYFPVALTANDYIYVLGGIGYADDSTVERYDISTNFWSYEPSMPKARNLMAAAVYGDMIYMIGGSSKTNGADVYNLLERYDPVEKTWFTLTPMPTGRTSLTAAVVENKIYAIGGYANNTYLNVVECYNPIDNSWTNVTPMKYERALSATAVVNNKIYCIGGEYQTSSLNVVEEYNPVTDEWRDKTPMPYIGGVLTAAVLNNKIYVIGAPRNETDYYPTLVLEYDPNQDP